MRKRNRIVKIINISLITLFILVILLVIYLIKNKKYEINIESAISIKSNTGIIDSEYYKEFLSVVNKGKFKKTKKEYGGIHKELTIKTKDTEYKFYIYTDKNVVTYKLDNTTYVNEDINYINSLEKAIKKYDYSLYKLSATNITYYKGKIINSNAKYNVDLNGENTILVEFNKDIKSIKFYEVFSDDSEILISEAKDLSRGDKIVYYIDHTKYKKVRLEATDDYKLNVYESYIVNDRLKFNELTQEKEIVLNPKDLQLIKGNSVEVSVENYKGLVYWYSEDEEIVTVKDGVVKALKEGTTRIYVITQDNEYIYMNVSVEEQKSILVSDITLSDEVVKIGMYRTHQLDVTIKPEDATNKKIQWSSSNSKVAMVDDNGLITGLSSGKAIISARSSNGLVKNCEVFVERKEVISITLNYTLYNLKLGETVDLDVTFDPVDASIRDILWQTKDSYVATVDASGVVTAKDYGKTVITATTKNGKSATCIINVTK